MKYLVTGGAGYIGSHTVFRLIEAGHEVVVLDDLRTGHLWAVHPEAMFVVGDAGDESTLFRLISEHRFDGVLHFAGSLNVSESVNDPSKYFRNNTLATLNLVETCTRLGGGKILFSSTTAVYGETDLELTPEERPLRPLSPYGASKAICEGILRDYATRGGNSLKYVCLRYSNVAGARPDLRLGQGGRVSYQLIKIAAEAAVGARESVVIHGTDYPTRDGTCLRDYLHVEDLAEVHLEALEYLEGEGESGIFNVGYERAYSVREVIETMKTVSGVDFEVIEGPRRPGDPSCVVADARRIREELGWNPKFNELRSICETAFEWEKVFQEKFRNRP